MSASRPFIPTDPELEPNVMPNAASRLRIRHALPALALLLPLAASAHVGVDAGAHHGFMAGLLHPFTGLDHLAAMLAIGYWSAIAAPRRMWLPPLAFASMVLVGALLGLEGVPVPVVEPMIATSLLFIGLLVATRTQLPVWAMALCAGGFALFHGAAHGVELGGVAALIGMLLGTVTLHLAGIWLGKTTAMRTQWAMRAGGVAVAALGSALLMQLRLA